MADIIVTSSQLTLLEMAKRSKDGNTITIAEVLTKKNEILLDAVWQEANDKWSHKSTIRTSEPEGTYRGMNEGVGAEASGTDEITDKICMFETYSKPDKSLIDNEPNPEQARMNEATAFLNGLGKSFAAGVFYANNATNPRQPTGLAPRLNDLDMDNVVSAGGSGNDLTSIYVVGWDPNSTFLTHPRAHKTAGIEREDLGVQIVQDDAGKSFRAYVDWFKLYWGMVCKDLRTIGRVCNIEQSGTGAFNEDLLIQLINRLELEGTKAAIYCNRDVKTQMDILLKDKANVNFAPAKGRGLFGEDVLAFKDIPIRRCDAILNTESAVV